MKLKALAIAYASFAAATSYGALYKFEVPLEGAQESPGPGDPDGMGLATLFVDSTDLTVTWNISVQDIAPHTLAHIHQAPAGAAGPVRVDFAAMLTGGPVADPDLAGVLADPTGWYVNVHNADFPAGAIRGQLSDPVRVNVPEGTPGIAATFVTLGGLVLAARRRRRG
jgi:hypothetical protein